MAMKLCRYHIENVVKDYLVADSFVLFTSILAGFFMCKMAYDVTHFFSSFKYKGYNSLTKLQRIEWNNRGMSSTHAIFITIMSLYLAFFSDLYSDTLHGLIAVGYFITDLAMIIWLYPSLGGMEYILHHLVSLGAITYAMLFGEGQLYTFICLISETTTPGINLRWYLDTSGMKNSWPYLINGVAMFVTWLVARIFLFMYLFYHIFSHYDQIKQMDTIGFASTLLVPSVLSIMNIMWFQKITKGLKKTMSKRE